MASNRLARARAGGVDRRQVILQQNDADGSVQRQTFQLRLHDAGAWLVESHSEERG